MKAALAAMIDPDTWKTIGKHGPTIALVLLLTILAQIVEARWDVFGAGNDHPSHQEIGEQLRIISLKEDQNGKSISDLTRILTDTGDRRDKQFDAMLSILSIICSEGAKDVSAAKLCGDALRIR